MEEIQLKNLPIELGKLLKYAGLAESGGQAKHMIANGEVSINGTAITQKSHKVQAGDKLSFAGNDFTITTGEN